MAAYLRLCRRQAAPFALLMLLMHSSVYRAVTRALQGMTLLSPLQEPLAICQLYRSLGPAMVAKLHGDFAFVLHDSRLVRRLMCWPTHSALQSISIAQLSYHEC